METELNQRATEVRERDKEVKDTLFCSMDGGKFFGLVYEAPFTIFFTPLYEKRSIIQKR